MAKKEKPELHLVGSKGSKTGLPSLEDIMALVQKLTGREPTAKELQEAREVLEE